MTTQCMGSIVAAALATGIAVGEDVVRTVRDAAGLREALRQAVPGTTIRLLPGDYGHGVRLDGLCGTPDRRVVIAGADPLDPPRFGGGTEALHLSDCNHVTLRNLVVAGCSGNGINADDAGTFDTPSIGLMFDGLRIESIGPQGNHDALKLSGLQRFVVTNCAFSGWGGSAIDMVGCSDGRVTASRFVGRPGYTQSSGIQAKGGTERVRVEHCYFERAGARALNLGGSTGTAFFRPAVRDFEARGLEVVGNRFVGGEAPIAFTTSDGCVVRNNTFHLPEKWVVRILQEQPTDRFLRCQRGVFERNLVVFDRRVRTVANIGPNTLPETFVFRGNAWFCAEGERRPDLPVAEEGGVYQVDPQLQEPGTPRMRVASADPRLVAVGAEAAARQGPDSATPP